MKHARDVAQAVVRTRPALPSWTCIGPRRRVVHTSFNCKADDLPEAPLVTERTCVSGVCEVVSRNPVSNEVEYCSSAGGLEHDETDYEDHIQVDRAIATSTLEDITEGELWYELEKELQRQENETDNHAQEEEAVAAIEITEDENMLADAVESRMSISSLNVSDNLQFYPPGRIMHLVSVPSSVVSELGEGGPTAEHAGLYETPRELYSKLRLSRTMINDHYMPMYKKMMELVIAEIENQEE